MDNYSINYVEQLTGVKAHTLRIWEKRYKTLIPHRTDTNIRYYDGEQLRKLLNITTLLRHGYKISKVMEMPDDKLNKLIFEISEGQKNIDIFDVHIAELVKHMVAFDEPSFDKTCSGIFIRFGIYDAMLKVIYPFLRKTGVLWSTLNAAPSHEHFASNIIRRKLLSAIDGIPYPVNPPNKFLLFLPPDEWHEIGLILSDYLIRNSGSATVYLGQNVPFESIHIALEKTKATHILTFFTSGINLSDHLKRIVDITVLNGMPKILVNSLIKTEQNHENIVFLQYPDSLLKEL